MSKKVEKCHCVNGRMFDPNIQQFVVCPLCKGKSREIIEEDSKESEEILGIGSGGWSGELVPESIIPKSERAYIEDITFQSLKEEMMSLYNSLVLGKKPKYSVCFGLGVKGRFDGLAYSLLSQAYKGGLRVSPFLSAFSLSNMLLNQDFSIVEYFDTDVCVVLVNEGCTKADVATCKGLLQERSFRNNATIFITTWSVEACSNLLGGYDDESLALAKPVFVKYKYSGESSPYINDLYGEKNYIPEIKFEEFDGLV